MLYSDPEACPILLNCGVLCSLVTFVVLGEPFYEAEQWPCEHASTSTE